jgi:hypothetical protein
MTADERKEKIAFLKRLVAGQAELTDLVDPERQVWVETTEGPSLYQNVASNAMLTFEELESLRARMKNHVEFVVMHLRRKIDPATPGYLTMKLDSPSEKLGSSHPFSSQEGDNELNDSDQ